MSSITLSTRIMLYLNHDRTDHNTKPMEHSTSVIQLLLYEVNTTLANTVSKWLHNTL